MRIRSLCTVLISSVLVGCSSNAAEQAKQPTAPTDEATLPGGPAEEPAPPGSSGDYDPCADKSCGDSCTICAPDDADCVETMEVKVCNASGECTGQAADCP